MKNNLVDQIQSHTLIQAIEHEHFDQVLNILTEAQLNSINVDVITMALHKMVSTICHNQPKNYLQIIELLLKNGASINKPDESGDTPFTKLLYFTTNPLYENHLKAIELLLQHGADIHSISQNRTTLMLAVHNIDMLKLLLKYGADINQSNNEGQTVLMLAATYDKLDIVQFLLNQGADIKIKDNNNNSIVAYATDSNEYAKRYKVLQFLLTHSEKLNTEDITLAQNTIKKLQNTEEKNRIKVIESKDFLQIYELFEVNSLKELLSKFKDLIKINDNNFIQRLNTDIRNSQNLNYDTLYPVYAKDVMLLLFTNASNLELTDIQFLLKNKAYVNIQSQDSGHTALHIIARKLFLYDNPNTAQKIIKELLAYGINIDICDNEGETALDYAKKFNNKEFIQLLKKTF